MTRETLEELFDPRRNALGAVRLALAAAVALSHSQVLGFGDQPHLGQVTPGDLAVDGFFVLSGFLVARSASRLPTLRRYAWHRALRILPGFWVCLVVTAFVFAPLIALLRGEPLAMIVTGSTDGPGFVANNAALLMRQWDIGDLAANVDADALNGSLWTLVYEAACYVMIGALVAVGALARQGRAWDTALGRRLGPLLPQVLRRHAVLAVTVLVWALYVVHASGIALTGNGRTFRLVLMFLLGALAHLYPHRVVFTPARLLGAAAVFGVGVALFEDPRPLSGLAFAYLFGWAAVKLPVALEPRVDVSYGVYVYHWPVALVLADVGLPTIGRVPFALLVLAATAGLATLSWRWVEGPALAFKNAVWVDGRAPADRPTRGRHALAKVS